MNNIWDLQMEQIRTKNEIDNGHRERLIRTVTVLRDKLGEDWQAPADHPLLWSIQNIYGTPFDRILSMLADYMVALETVQGAQDIINRIKSAEEYEGAAAELEVGGMLARNGYTLTIGPQFGDKRPDFLCEQNGAKFLAEVKTLKTSEETKEVKRTSERIIAACSPIFPAGTIFKPLSGSHLAEVERMLEEKTSCVTKEVPQEADVPSELKLYLVHPDDPDRVGRYDKWCREQERLGIIPYCGGLSGPPEDLTDLSRIRTKIRRLAIEEQIPSDMMGVLFILGRFILRDVDVKGVVDCIIAEMRRLHHIPAVVLGAAKTTMIEQEPGKVVEDKDHIDIIHCLAPCLKERILIIKNKSCRFDFDYSILRNMYSETRQ